MQNQTEILYIDGTTPISTASNNQINPNMYVCLNFIVTNADQGVPYQVRLTMQNDGEAPKQIGYSAPQVADSKNEVVFNLSFIVDYFFQKIQYVIIDIAKQSTFLSTAVPLSNILVSKDGETKLQLANSKEGVIVSGSQINKDNKYLSIELSLQNCSYPAFYVIKKSKMNLQSGMKEFIAVFKSETSSNGQFQPSAIPLSLLNYGIADRPICFEVYTNKGFLGFGETTVSVLLQNEIYSMTIGGSTAFIKAKEFQQQQMNFVQQVQNHLQFNLTIGIDFTGSNGHYKDEGTLHYLSNNLNLYQSAIVECGKILAPYDADQVYPCYGFGAIVPGENSVSHCFPLSLSPNGDPNIHGIDNVLSTYCATVPRITFSGPTFFAPLLTEIFTIISSLQGCGDMTYNIILLLTDGMINDIDDTIDVIVGASNLPVSLIIVGVGDADFSNMRELDCDNGFLEARNGTKSNRDIVQFVEYKEAGNNAKKLAEMVLEELPRQVEKYFYNKNK